MLNNEVNKVPIKKDSLLSFSQPSVELKGDVLIVAANKEYIDLFFDQIWNSFKNNLLDWQLFLIIVGKDSDELMSFEKKYMVYEGVSVSSALISLPEYVEYNKNWRGLSDEYLKMLAVKRFKENFFLRQLCKFFLKLKVSPTVFLSKKFLISDWFRVVYSCSRFVVPGNFFLNCNKIAVVDIDSVITSSFDDVVSSAKTLSCMKSKNKWSRYLAGIVVLPNNNIIQDFYTLMNSKTIDAYYEGRFSWGVDQLILDDVMNSLEGTELINAMCFNLKNRNGEALVSWKGNEKFKVRPLDE